MKTKEELNALKEEVEAVNEKLAELTPEEIAQITGGGVRPGRIKFDVEHKHGPVAIEYAAFIPKIDNFE